MHITQDELDKLKRTIDFMEDAITDIVGWANDPGNKIRTMHEVKRIHGIASELIEEVSLRDRSKIQGLNIGKKERWTDKIRKKIANIAR